MTGDEGAALVVGAVDLYQHAEPDLFPRRGDDIDLAREAAAAGFAAVVHRHHFSPTAERGTLARKVTGFPILGAILLNDSVGGLNPTAVELALDMGAVWVGLPTLSAHAQRQRIASMPPSRSQALGFGPGRLRLTDGEGVLLPSVHDIMDLAAARSAPVNLGYASFPECLAAVRAAAGRVHALVVTNPLTTMRLSMRELDELLVEPSVVVEQTCYSLHPSGSYGGGKEGFERVAALIAAVGASRVVLSSDGGLRDAPPPAELLAWSCGGLLEAGVTADDLRCMTATTPTRLLENVRAPS